MKKRNITFIFWESEVTLMELISIIVPVYNTEAYLERCVNSLLQQTYPNIEIILIDDESPDNAGALCAQLAEQHTNIKVYHQKNLGLSGARNTGITHANGKYLLFIDSDDYIAPMMVSELYQYTTKHDLDIMACTATRSTTPDFSGPDNFEMVSGEEAMHRALHSQSVEVCTKLYKKSLFDTVRFPVGRVFEDVATTYRLYHLAKKVGYIQKPYLHYFYNPNSITQTAFRVKPRFDYILATQERLAFVKKHNFTRSLQVCEEELVKACLSCLTTIYATTVSNEYLSSKEYQNIKEHLLSFRTRNIPIKHLNLKYKLFLITFDRISFIHKSFAELSLLFKKFKKMIKH